MNNLVVMQNRQVTTTSLLVAEYFEKSHTKIVRDIEDIRLKFNKAKNGVIEFGEMFRESTYLDSRNRKQTMYKMNRDGFTLLVMGFTGQKAFDIKLLFIKAFNKMEQFILNQQNQQWLQYRNDGKTIRREFTDVLDVYIDYAYSQGSTSANKYFMIYTKLVNKTLELNPKQRDFVDIRTLNAIALLENTMGNIIIAEMEKGTYYKDIYKMCRDNCIEFMKGVLIKKPALPKYQKTS